MVRNALDETGKLSNAVIFCHTNIISGFHRSLLECVKCRVDTKWRFQFFAKYDYRFMLDVIIAIIATFFAKAIIAISRLSLSISLE